MDTTLPTELTNIGPERRSYDMLSFLRGDETSVKGHTIVERAIEMNAHLGEDDGQYLLDNQRDIPVALRGKVAFVFTDWRHVGVISDSVYFVYWNDYRWIRFWYGLEADGLIGGLVLRRK